MLLDGRTNLEMNASPSRRRRESLLRTPLESFRVTKFARSDNELEVPTVYKSLLETSVNPFPTAQCCRGGQGWREPRPPSSSTNSQKTGEVIDEIGRDSKGMPDTRMNRTRMVNRRRATSSANFRSLGRSVPVQGSVNHSAVAKKETGVNAYRNDEVRG